MNDEGHEIFCSRCGAEMNSNSRYCMKCGYLNPEHEANKGMQPYIQNQVNTYSVGVGVQNNPVNQGPMIGLATDSGKPGICFLVNFLLFVVIMGVLLFLAIQVSPNELNMIVYSFFPIACIFVSFFFFFHYGLQLLFMKSNQRWWKAWIPIYNLVVLGTIAFHSKSKGLLALIPIIGMIIVLYRLGKEYEYNSILTILLFFIYIPLMGYGSHFYGRYSYVSSADSKVVEKNYKLQKTLYRLFLGFVVIGGILLLIANLTAVKAKGHQLSNYYYVYAAKKYAKKVEKLVPNKKFDCRDVGIYSETSGYYYFLVEDARDEVFLPFSIFREPISIYVLLDNNGSTPVYYVSVSDGTYGFPPTKVEDLNINTPVEYPSLGIDYYAPNVCTVY